MPAFERGQWPVYISFASDLIKLIFYPLIGHFREGSCLLGKKYFSNERTHKRGRLVPSSEKSTLTFLEKYLRAELSGFYQKSRTKSLML